MDPAKLQMDLRHNTEDLQSFLRDMGSWEEDMKKKDKKLTQERREEIQNIPPVRGNSTTPAAAASAASAARPKKDQKKAAGDKATSKIPGYDYRAWDKFDADKMCSEMDEKEALRTDPALAPTAQRGGGTSHDEQEDETLSEDGDLDDELATMRELAVMHKDKGNTFFKKGNYSAAIECYTKGMTADPSNSVLPANRAMALLKCDRFAAALQDCEVALSLDPKYVKARLRRAAAFVGLGHRDDAVRDYEEVLRLEPGNKQAKDDMKKLKMSVNGASRATSSHTPARPRSQKPLYRMPIEEIGRAPSPPPPPIVSVAETTAATGTVVTSGRPEQPSSSSKPISVSEWLAQDPRVIRTHDLLSSTVDSALAQSQGGRADAVSASLPSSAPAVEGSQAASSDLPLANGSSGAAPKTPALSLPVPRSAFQLSKDLQRLSGQSDALYSYVKAIPSTSYASILKQSLDSDVLLHLLTAYRDCFTRRGESVLKQLEALRRVKRFETALMLFGSSDKQVIQDLFDQLSAIHGEDDVSNLRRAYGA